MPSEQTDWFSALTGFEERPYEETQRRLVIEGNRLHSPASGRSYAIGNLETPSLLDLRDRAAAVIEGLRGHLRVSTVSGDIRKIHKHATGANALFQVASQFNLLEMVSPRVRPEDGVTRYQSDPTQGPACAIAAGAATIFRNYFAPVGDQIGQTQHCQIDCLRDVGSALGNDGGQLWRMQNGYAQCTQDGLQEINGTLSRLDDAGRNRLRDQLRIGIHWNVAVTDVGAPDDQLVSQAFCSALPIAYAQFDAPKEVWRLFATLVLEGAYEATMWSAVLNGHQYGSTVAFLTRLGGGAFGNETAWIDAAMRRALTMVAGTALDVRIVSRDAPDRGLLRLVDEFSQPGSSGAPAMRR